MAADLVGYPNPEQAVQSSSASRQWDEDQFEFVPPSPALGRDPPSSLRQDRRDYQGARESPLLERHRIRMPQDLKLVAQTLGSCGFPK
jgi:hypothetical protein